MLYCHTCQNKLDGKLEIEAVTICQICGEHHTLAELKQVRIESFVYSEEEQ